MLALGACSTTHEFRVASVGDGARASADGAASSGSTAPFIVASGNVFLGAGTLASPAGTAPATGTASGTISNVLTTTGQTVVELANGAFIVVDGLGGTLGDVVAIDFAQGQLIGDPVALVGQDVISASPVSNTLTGVSTATGDVLGGTSLSNGRTSSSLFQSNAGQLLGTKGSTAVVTRPVTRITKTVTGTLPLCC
jgi:hypothetical protein